MTMEFQLRGTKMLYGLSTGVSSMENVIYFFMPSFVEKKRWLLELMPAK